MTDTHTLDRTQQPPIFDIEAPTVLNFDHSKLTNGIDFYVMQGGTQAITKIDIVTKSGVQYADKAFVTNATNSLAGEGTASFTSEQIAQQLDFYGAFLTQKSTNFDSVISIVTPSKHLRNVLPVFEEIIKAATFPQSEFDIYVEKTAQEIAINEQTPSYMARHNMKKLLFADGSRYARSGTVDYLRNHVSTDDQRKFYATTYTPEGTRIFVSGIASQSDIDLIASTFSDTWRPMPHLPLPDMPVFAQPARTAFHVMDSAQQVTICMGRPFNAFGHADNLAMSVVDTIFGGYFGSRLMSNIREEKGLTYGIGSNLSVNRHYGLHCIVSDVRPDKCQLVLDEIAAEMHTLQTEPVSSEELDVVRNYMKGELLRQFDSVLATADTLSGVILRGGTSAYGGELFHTIDTITPDTIRDMAQRYLCFDQYCISLAGKKN